jgi:hypothetical protein
MWVEVTCSNLDDHTLTDSYNIYFADRVSKDERSELKCLSDMKLLCLDCISFLHRSTSVDGTTDVILSFSMNDFTEAYQDEITGWILSVQFKQPFEYNLCEVPYTGAVADSPSCRPVEIYENGILVATIDSGGVYSYTSSSGTFTYDVYFDGVYTGQDVTVDGTNITINLD